jgi:hypothetical protein
MADFMAIPLTAGPFQAAAASSFISAAKFPKPTAEQVLYARVKRALSIGEQRILPAKWERWKAADKEIRKYQGTLKRLPNNMKDQAFKNVSKQLGGGRGNSVDSVRHTYYTIRGLIKKVTGSSAG